MHQYRLYHYWRSSSSWRVRWAMALKNFECEYAPVDLLSGESESETHRERNPLGFVPVLEYLKVEDPSKRFLTESLAIIGWLDDLTPTPPLFPSDTWLRARTRELAEIINADTQPVQNPSVQIAHSSDADERKNWAKLWIGRGFTAYENIAKQTAGEFSVGNSITLADLCLIPQCYNALRIDIDLQSFPTIERIFHNAKKTEGYKLSEPDRFKPQETAKI